MYISPADATRLSHLLKRCYVESIHLNVKVLVSSCLSQQQANVKKLASDVRNKHIQINKHTALKLQQNATQLYLFIIH